MSRERIAKKPSTVPALLTGLLAALFVLATLVLVPSSVPVLADPEDPTILLTLASPKTLQFVAENPEDYPYQYIAPMVTGYSVCMATGVALAILLTAFITRKRGGHAATGVALALTSGAFAIVCSHLLYYVLCYSNIIYTLDGTPWFALEFWKGGYTMYGAIFGGLLGATVYALASHHRVSEALTRIVPGMLLLVMMGRLGEHFTGTLHGIGGERATEALSFLPFTKSDMWGDAYMAVYVYEALAALMAFVVCMVQTLRRSPAGRGAENGLAILSAWQVLLESCRNDNEIRFGFVRLNMIAAAAVLAWVLVTRLIRGFRHRGVTAWSILRILLLLVGAALVIAMEFALDGKIQLPVSNTVLYGVSTLGVIMMMCATVFVDNRARRGDRKCR